ncbi:MAG: hypothetical protein KJS98_10695, partial [Nitrospirae bacterium]|nr:hypothetical protein [Nitrospirota bacterium]
LLMLVAACSGPVATEWIMVKDRTPTGDGSVTYAAPSTIRKSFTTVKMWSLIDSTVIQGDALDRPRFSWIDDWEYDCQGQTLRLLRFSEYSGKMGTGENVFSQALAGSHSLPVNPGTVSETLWKLACGKE